MWCVCVVCVCVCVCMWCVCVCVCVCGVCVCVCAFGQKRDRKEPQYVVMILCRPWFVGCIMTKNKLEKAITNPGNYTALSNLHKHLSYHFCDTSSAAIHQRWLPPLSSLSWFIFVVRESVACFHRIDKLFSSVDNYRNRWACCHVSFQNHWLEVYIGFILWVVNEHISADSWLLLFTRWGWGHYLAAVAKIKTLVLVVMGSVQTSCLLCPLINMFAWALNKGN